MLERYAYTSIDISTILCHWCWWVKRCIFVTCQICHFFTLWGPGDCCQNLPFGILKLHHDQSWSKQYCLIWIQKFQLTIQIAVSIWIIIEINHLNDGIYICSVCSETGTDTDNFDKSGNEVRSVRLVCRTLHRIVSNLATYVDRDKLDRINLLHAFITL